MVVFEHCIEIYITNECNLTCSNCNRFNNYNFQGHYSWTDSADAIGAWAKRISSPVIMILGGEPTMHPDLDQWVTGLQQCWPDSTVCIQSNGTQLHRVKDQVPLDYVGVSVAVHDSRIQRKMMPQWNKVRAYVESATEFNQSTVIDQGSYFTVHNSDADQAFECCSMKYSHTIFQGRLYKCPMVAVLPEFAKQYQVNFGPGQQELLNSYVGLSPDCTDQELNDFVAGIHNSIPQCNLCPGQYTTSTVTFDSARKKRKKISQ